MATKRLLFGDVLYAFWFCDEWPGQIDQQLLIPEVSLNLGNWLHLVIDGRIIVQHIQPAEFPDRIDSEFMHRFIIGALTIIKENCTLLGLLRLLRLCSEERVWDVRHNYIDTLRREVLREL